MSRVRSKILPYVPKGTFSYSSGGSFADFAFTLKSEVCTDLTGSKVDHALLIEKYDKSSIPPLNGRHYFDAVNYCSFVDYQPIGMIFTPAHISLSPPSALAAATTAMARTNPGRAEVSVPVFIRELKDLPHMLKSIGDLLLKSKRKPPLVKLASGEYLSWTFGWAPLISDLSKMLRFQELVAKRHKELERMHSKGGLKRRFTTFTDTNCSDTNDFVHSMGIVLTVRKSSKTSVKQWCTLRWLPSALPSGSVADLGKQAREAVTGLSGGIVLQPEDIWEIIPWSWLVDWFSNVGTFLQAHGNRIPSSVSVVNVMTLTETKIQLRRTDNFRDIKGCEGTVTRITKRRDLSVGGLSIGEGYLNLHQLSILGALAINRLSKRF